MNLLTRRTLLLHTATVAIAAPLGGRAQQAVSSPAAGALPSTRAIDPALLLLNRATWGAQRHTLDALQHQGPRDWLSQQLRPEPDPLAGLPPPVQAVIAALPLSGTPLPEQVRQITQQRRDAERLPDGEARVAARRAARRQLTQLGEQATQRLLLRALHSPHQLQERMTWFWCNHFSVFARKGLLHALVGDYEQQALRRHALGRFEDLLIAGTTHPAMLVMLDNPRNTAGHLNENHARELMELHTLGVEAGYTQQDVQALARILTGLGVQQGVMAFDPRRHDGEPKTWLGLNVAGRGWPEILQALQHLAQHPATARTVCTRLARHFLADVPPAAVVQAMTTRWQATQGHIGQTLQAMFETPETHALPPSKFKSPMHYVLSAVRLVHEGLPITQTTPLTRWLTQLGQLPFNHPTPEGYPDRQADWAASGQMQTRFEVARAIVQAQARLVAPDDPAAAPPPQPPGEATPTLYDPLLGPRTRAALAEARPAAPRTALLLSSPEFMLC